MQNTNPVTPVFLISLPRSGSTLLQRILMSHSQITSCPEPWLLFPFIDQSNYSDKLSNYSVKGYNKAMKVFVENYPKGQQHFIELTSNYLTNIYSNYCSSGEAYFIDKTPRYYFFIDRIKELFPNAKIIFLVRNPLAIVNSLLLTFSKNNFRYFARYHHDIFTGFSLVSQAIKKYKDVACVVSYEQLITEPDVQIEKCLKFLELENESGLVENFYQNKFKKKTMGDPTGQHKYKKIVNETEHKWRKNLKGIVRKKYVKNLLEQIPSEDYDLQGYSKKHTIEEISNIRSNMKYLLKDLIGIFAYKTIMKFNLNLLEKPYRKWFYS